MTPLGLPVVPEVYTIEQHLPYNNSVNYRQTQIKKIL